MLTYSQSFNTVVLPQSQVNLELPELSCLSYGLTLRLNLCNCCYCIWFGATLAKQ